MKKAVSLLLVFALCLSFCACGGKSDAPVKEEETREENYEVTETEPVIIEAEPQTVTIELSMDNWQEYFELVDDPVFRKNAFGEAEGFAVGVKLQLKEEYLQKSAYIMDGAIEYQMQYSVIGCDVDMKAETYKLQDIHTINENVYTRMNELSNSLRIGGGDYIEEKPSDLSISTNEAIYGASGPYAKSVHGYPVNFNILRIQGTLVFLSNI